MRWYVSRNGETQGPVEETQLVGWIRGGMHDASIRDESGGNWMPLAQSPFVGLLPKPPPPERKSSPVGFVLALLVLSGAILFLVGVPAAALFFVVFGLIGAVVLSRR